MTLVVLVTGFGPFPGAPQNPSQILVEELQRTADRTHQGYELHTAVLPTRYDAGREAALRLYRRLNPDIAVHFGFSLKAGGFVLEGLAENRIAPGRLDAGGARPRRAAVRAGAPLSCPSTLPLDRIHGALRRRGLPVAFSGDAGAYVCNLVFYNGLLRRGGPRPAMAGFIHVPLTADMQASAVQRARAGRGLVTLSRTELVGGARLIIQTCAECYSSTSEDRRATCLDCWSRPGPSPFKKKGRPPSLASGPQCI